MQSPALKSLHTPAMTMLLLFLLPLLSCSTEEESSLSTVEKVKAYEHFYRLAESGRECPLKVSQDLIKSSHAEDEPLKTLLKGLSERTKALARKKE